MSEKLINFINKIWKSFLIIDGYGYKCRVCGKLSIHHIGQRGDWYICDECVKMGEGDETPK